MIDLPILPEYRKQISDTLGRFPSRARSSMGAIATELTRYGGHIKENPIMLLLSVDSHRVSREPYYFKR